MSEDKQALIQYRLSQAKDSIREAEVLLGGAMSFRSGRIRLYYALFYAVLALLQEKKIGTSKHTGAIALFDREFIKSGLLDKSLSRILHRAFELRQKADYMEKGPPAPFIISHHYPSITSEFIWDLEISF